MAERRICIVGLPASIATLLYSRGPSAVAWRVGTVVVSTVNAVFSGRTRPHVGEEGREIIDPFVAHPDAAPAPVFVSRMRGVVAAALGVTPGLVFRGVPGPALVSVLQRAGERLCVFVATATNCLAGSQMASGYGLCCAAIAAAYPRSLRGGVIAPNHKESPKSVIREIYQIRMICHV